MLKAGCEVLAPIISGMDRQLPEHWKMPKSSITVLEVPIHSADDWGENFTTSPSAWELCPEHGIGARLYRPAVQRGQWRGKWRKMFPKRYPRDACEDLSALRSRSMASRS